MIGRDLARVDARCLDCVDQAEDLRDLGPAMDREQQFATGIDLHDPGARFTHSDSAHDVERRADQCHNHWMPSAPRRTPGPPRSFRSRSLRTDDPLSATGLPNLSQSSRWPSRQTSVCPQAL
jgi:hypothetical protein